MRPLLPSFAVILVATLAHAQTTATGTPAAPGSTGAQSGGQPAITRPNTDAMQGGQAPGAASPAAAKLEPGANSFTEGQARSRLEQAGFKDVSDLRKDDQGIWRGKASQGGRSVTVGLDYKGNVQAQ